MDNLSPGIGLLALHVGFLVKLFDMAVDYRRVLFESRTEADIQGPIEPLESVGVDRVPPPRFSEVVQLVFAWLEIQDPRALEGVSSPPRNLAGP